MKKIVIVGPESTGKTSLAKQLAQHFESDYIPEYAREYISNLDREYIEDDILAIAKKQLELQENYSSNKHFLFLDTDLIVCKIWSLFKYGKCHPWILEQITKNNDCHYLLCNIDLAWQVDPQREHPHQRQEIYDLYLAELQSNNYQYSIINGIGEERLQSAINSIQSL